MEIIIALAALALVLVLLDTFYSKLPKALQKAFDLWMKFAHALGYVMSRVILTILWIVVFGPYAIIWKLTHRQKKNPDSYWIEIDKSVEQKLEYQF